MDKEQGGTCPALVDTGADWYLIDENLLNQEERHLLTNDLTGLEGQGVPGQRRREPEPGRSLAGFQFQRDDGH